MFKIIFLVLFLIPLTGFSKGLLCSVPKANGEGNAEMIISLDENAGRFTMENGASFSTALRIYGQEGHKQAFIMADNIWVMNLNYNKRYDDGANVWPFEARILHGDGPNEFDLGGCRYTDNPVIQLSDDVIVDSGRDNSDQSQITAESSSSTSSIQ